MENCCINLNMKIFIDIGFMWRCFMRNNKFKVLLGIFCLVIGMVVILLMLFFGWIWLVFIVLIFIGCGVLLFFC